MMNEADFIKIGGCSQANDFATFVCYKITWTKNREKPALGDAILVELDEMWHYLKSKKQVMDMESLS